MSDIYDYQVEHLLLLVGSNPLPNVVAGKLLTAPAGTISLIHSKDSFELAERLKTWLRKEGLTNVHLAEVEASNVNSVRERVLQVLNDYKRDRGNKAEKASIGLHYTGGTKVMSVQAYRMLEDWTKKHGGDAIFSYLDAKTLCMCFDPTPDKPAPSFYVGRGVDINILDLLNLHDWEPIKSVPPGPVEVPVLPRSALALLTLHSNIGDASIWTNWLNDELFAKARELNSGKLVNVPRPFLVYQSGQVLQEQERYEVKQPRSNAWQNSTKLRAVELAMPNLPNLKEVMSNEFGQDVTDKLRLTAGKGEGRCNKEDDFCKWLSGTWLESAVLSVLQNCAQELHLRECCMDIKPKALRASKNKELFQFDVVAIRGYQLFAFSCTTEGKDRGLLKQKLFEAYVRARQMGGDEACVALVCCMEQGGAAELEEEMRCDVSPEGRIRVFSREDLANLDGHIKDWVREQSKED